MDHHHIFSEMPRWKGKREPGFIYNFLGVKTRNKFLEKDSVDKNPLNNNWNLAVIPGLPAFNSEYFDWVEVLKSVISAKDQFVMIELGAGYGRWLVNAAVALRYINPIPVALVAVEAEPLHFQWIREHFSDNDINPKKHQFINAAISPKHTYVRFWIGNPSEWYGQMLALDQDYSTLDLLKSRFNHLFRSFLPQKISEEKRIVLIKSIPLNIILSDFTKIDLITMDIQEMEFLVIEDSIEQLDQKVKKIHIATHLPEIEEQIRTLMHGHKWENINDYHCMSTNQTPYGDIYFLDGVQTWINPFLKP